jgi:hypothetical protein
VEEIRGICAVAVFREAAAAGEAGRGSVLCRSWPGLPRQPAAPWRAHHHGEDRWGSAAAAEERAREATVDVAPPCQELLGRPLIER